MDNVEKIELFFKYNLLIKKLINGIAPDSELGYNEDYTVKYKEKVFKTIEEIHFYILRMANLLDYSNKEHEEIEVLFNKLFIKLDACYTDFSKLKEFVLQYVFNLSEELQDKVKNNCFGYGGMGVSLNEANSLNELAHIMHNNLTNNNQLYSKMPIISQKGSDDISRITLYGKNNKLAFDLFNIFNEDICLGITSILALDNKILMMIRDRGHALSIEIRQNGNMCEIDYFIPKICSVELVNKLPGINKVNENSTYAFGFFNCELDNAPLTIANFIANVPDDFLMPPPKVL